MGFQKYRTHHPHECKAHNLSMSVGDPQHSCSGVLWTLTVCSPPKRSHSGQFGHMKYRVLKDLLNAQKLLPHDLSGMTCSSSFWPPSPILLKSPHGQTGVALDGTKSLGGSTAPRSLKPKTVWFPRFLGRSSSGCHQKHLQKDFVGVSSMGNSV